MSTIITRYEMRAIGTKKINGTMSNAKEKFDRLVNNYNIMSAYICVSTTDGKLVKLDVDFAEIETFEPYEEDN